MKNIFRKGTSALLAVVMALSAFMGIGATTAFAAEAETSEVVMLEFPRDGDENYGAEWGCDALTFKNGWTQAAHRGMTYFMVGSWYGNACYCIEPGVPVNIGDTVTKNDESYWDNFSSQYNGVISGDDVKLLIGRIFQYGYTGTITSDWRSQNEEDANKMAYCRATQLLVWETIVGERDADFNHVGPGSCDAVLDTISANHPLRDKIMAYYNSIVSGVQSHSQTPSFMAKTPSKAQTVEMEWDGSQYIATLSDTRGVLGNYSFSSNQAGMSFKVSGHTLTITSATAPTGTTAITAEKANSQRKGVVVWGDGIYAPGTGQQDLSTFTAEVNDPIQAFLNVRVSYGSAKIVKTSEDGKVGGISFTISGNGINETVKTNSSGEIVLDNLMPGTYTVTEQTIGYYLPQESKTVTVVNGQTATVEFSNVLKRSDLKVIKTSEDNMNEGIKFRLYGTSSSGANVDLYATTDASGTAVFHDVLIGSNYTLEEVDTAEKYIVPDSQNAVIEWEKVTQNSFYNELKRGDLKVTKTSEDGLVAGVEFHLYGTSVSGTAIDMYATTDENGVAMFEDVLIGSSYVLEEINTAERYIIPDSQTVAIEWNKVTGCSVENVLKRGDLQVTKTSEDGLVEGMRFHLYGTSLSGIAVDEYAVTDASGVATFSDILIGSGYVLEEVDTAERYIIPESQSVAVEWNKVTKRSMENILKRGNLDVTKNSEDGLNEGVVFHLYGTSLSGIVVDEYAVTDASGVAAFRDILISGNEPYVIEEVDTAIRYVVPENQTAPIEWNKVTNRTFENILKKFNVTVIKTDSETGNPQGDATLEGATYGIYKGEELIDVYATDANGQFTTKYYVCGDDWTIREINPSEGYLLDSAIHKVGAEPGLFTVELNDLDMDVVEDIVKGKISIIKHSDNGDTQIETPEEDAVFQIYLKSAGSYAAAKESEREILTCDENGFAQTKDLPYGTYTVHQVSGWEGRELMDDFDVYIAKDGETYRYLINNANFASYIKVVKKDVESGKVIPYAGSGFQIYRPDGSKIEMTYTYPEVTVVDTFYTNAEGYLVTPEKLEYGSGYYLVEVEAPYGYVLDSNPVYFDVSEDNSSDESGITVIEVVKTNIAQKGIIRIFKTGEVFSTVIEKEGIFTPVFEVKGLAGATYEVIALVDIYTPDGTLRATAGEVVDTVTTDVSGVAETKELYLGKYAVKEIQAPFGMTINGAVHEVELVYAGQPVEITEVETDYYNERQKVELVLRKEMEQDATYGYGMNGELADVTFGLYAASDIVAADGSVIPADALIEVVSISEDGTAKFSADLPVGSLYAKELSTNPAYVLDSEKYPVVFEYAGQETAVVTITVNNGESIGNELIRGNVSGVKKTEDGAVLGGALIGLFHADETEFTEATAIKTVYSAADGSFAFENIAYGNYVVREIASPTGFVLSEISYPIVISEDGMVIEIEIGNKNIRGNVSLTKVDKDFPDNHLSGAVFELYEDSNGDSIFDEGDKLIGTLEELDGGVYQWNNLLFGGYFVKEKTAPAGFILDTNAYYFAIVEDGKTVIVENEAGVGFTNAAQTGKIRIEKTSEDNVLAGFTFKVEGTDITGQKFSKEYVTDEKGEIHIEGLRIGDYTISEVSNDANAKYVLPGDVLVTVHADKTVVAKFHNELKPVTDIPQTGDTTNIALWAALAGVSLVGAVAAGFVTFRKKKKEDQ